MNKKIIEIFVSSIICFGFMNIFAYIYYFSFIHTHEVQLFESIMNNDIISEFNLSFYDIPAWLVEKLSYINNETRKKAILMIIIIPLSAFFVSLILSIKYKINFYYIISISIYLIIVSAIAEIVFYYVLYQNVIVFDDNTITNCIIDLFNEYTVAGGFGDNASL